MKKRYKIIIIIVIIYSVFCMMMYFLQEKFIFFPVKISKNYHYTFEQKFEEVNFKTEDGIILNGVLFKSDSSKGLIFYLHGNAGSVNTLGELAGIYSKLKYDLFIPDYRGYGKSGSKIKNEKQFYKDMQLVYDKLKSRYAESNIIIIGNSIGTGPATELASINHPKLLILEAPYYNLKDLSRHLYPGFPAFILKYKFETNRFIKKCKMPVVIFHGIDDEVIYYESSVKLQKLFKKSDTLISLILQKHNGINENPEYLTQIRKILEKND